MLIGASSARSGQYRIILQLEQQQLRLLVLRHRETGLPEVVVNDTTELTSSFADALSRLNQTYSKLELKAAQVSLILGVSHYQSVTVDRPDVPDTDIAASLVFQLGELIELEPEEMVTDYYELAYQPSGHNKVVAVVAKKLELKEWIHAITECGWEPVEISIYETELQKLQRDKERAQLFLYPLRRGYLAQIYHKGHLCFTRPLSSLKSIDQYSKEEIKLGALEPLATELQRSMDYYESQLRQAPVKQIKLALHHPQISDVNESLAELLAVDVQRYVYEDWMTELCEGDFSDIAAFAAAIDKSATAGNSKEGDA